jgi:ATP-dependent DNA ligase
VRVCKATLASVLRKARPGLVLNEHLEHEDGEVVFRHACKLGLEGIIQHIEEPGDVVFRHACKLGFEGIVSKRLGSRYRSGRSPDWLKFTPAAPAVT